MGFFQRLDQRSDQMGRMADHLGIDLAGAMAAAPGKVRSYRSAVLGCASCGSVDKCAAWLDSHERADAAPKFCRNGGWLKTLRD